MVLCLELGANGQPCSLSALLQAITRDLPGSGARSGNQSPGPTPPRPSACHHHFPPHTLSGLQTTPFALIIC